MGAAGGVLGGEEKPEAPGWRGGRGGGRPGGAGASGPPRDKTTTGDTGSVPSRLQGSRSPTPRGAASKA